jgi:lipopolysaccharide biosynthesis glycosyltransferase
MLTLALFSDRNMLPGLHVTLLSLLESLGPGTGEPVEIRVFCDRVDREEQELLRRTHAASAAKAALRLHDYSPQAPPGGPSLLGNQTIYGRLHLAELLPECDRCVFLDADLLVNRCVRGLAAAIDGRHPIAAVGIVRRGESMDRRFFATLGLDPGKPCLNAGVMAIDLELWRKRQVRDRCFQIAREHPGEFLVADQTMLNAALDDDWKPIDRAWNTLLRPGAPPVTALEPRIYHFVQSPKPWDFPGGQLSNHHVLWKAFFARTALGSVRRRYTSAWRNVRILRQTIQLMMSRRLRGPASP